MNKHINNVIFLLIGLIILLGVIIYFISANANENFAGEFMLEGASTAEGVFADEYVSQHDWSAFGLGDERFPFDWVEGESNIVVITEPLEYVNGIIKWPTPSNLLGDNFTITNNTFISNVDKNGIMNIVKVVDVGGNIRFIGEEAAPAHPIRVKSLNVSPNNIVDTMTGGGFGVENAGGDFEIFVELPPGAPPAESVVGDTFDVAPGDETGYNPTSYQGALGNNNNISLQVNLADRRGVAVKVGGTLHELSPALTNRVEQDALTEMTTSINTEIATFTKPGARPRQAFIEGKIKTNLGFEADGGVLERTIYKVDGSVSGSNRTYIKMKQVGGRSISAGEDPITNLPTGRSGNSISNNVVDSWELKEGDMIHEYKYTFPNNPEKEDAVVGHLMNNSQNEWSFNTEGNTFARAQDPVIYTEVDSSLSDGFGPAPDTGAGNTVIYTQIPNPDGFGFGDNADPFAEFNDGVGSAETGPGNVVQNRPTWAAGEFNPPPSETEW